MQYCNEVKFILTLNATISLSCSPGMALTLESGMEMCHGHNPFFQANQHSLAYQFTINVQLICPSFLIFF